MRPSAVVLLLCTTPALGGTLPPDLAKALEAFDRAHYQSDVARLTELTSDGYMVLNSNISLENKKEFLADYGLPGFRIEPYTRSEESNVAWKDSAVTAGVVNLKWVQDGKHHTRRLRYVDVWRKHDGRWEATFTQVTRAEQ